MHLIKNGLLLLFICAGMLLQAQSTAPPATKAGFWLQGSLGTFLEGDGSSFDKDLSPLSLSLGYQRPLTDRLSLIGGLGIQRRSAQTIITASGEPCFFPLGIKVTQFTDAESYEVSQTEIFVKAGFRYQLNRFGFELCALPAFRLNNEITYRFFREFLFPDLPPAEIDQTVSSGEIINLAEIGQGARSIQYEQRFNLQAEVAVDYLITSRLRIGLAVRPILTEYDLSITEQSVFCTDPSCPPINGTPLTIASLTGTSGLLRLGFNL